MIIFFGKFFIRLIVLFFFAPLIYESALNVNERFISQYRAWVAQ